MRGGAKQTSNSQNFQLFSLHSHSFSSYPSTFYEPIVDPNKDDGERTSEDHTDVYPYFSSSVYSGFDDHDTRNFFKVYSTLFEALDREEMLARQHKQKDSDDDDRDEDGAYRQAPSFGDSKTPWAAAERFYRHWSSFVSCKSFAWHDKWRLSDAENSWMRKEMKKENERERSKARKDFVEAVRVCNCPLFFRYLSI